MITLAEYQERKKAEKPLTVIDLEKGFETYFMITRISEADQAAILGYLATRSRFNQDNFIVGVQSSQSPIELRKAFLMTLNDALAEMKEIEEKQAKAAQEGQE